VTRVNYGKIFNDLFIANLLLSVIVKEFRRSVRIQQSYSKKLSGTFFSGHGVLLAKTITHPAARSLCDSWAFCLIVYTKILFKYGNIQNIYCVVMPNFTQAKRSWTSILKTAAMESPDSGMMMTALCVNTISTRSPNQHIYFRFSCAVLKCYSRFRLWPMYTHLHVILHQPAICYPNRTTRGGDESWSILKVGGHKVGNLPLVSGLAIALV